jgi:hypothetical protein
MVSDDETIAYDQMTLKPIVVLTQSGSMALVKISAAKTARWTSFQQAQKVSYEALLCAAADIDIDLGESVLP